MKWWIVLVVFLFLLKGVLGVEGVTPGSYYVDFEPGLEKEFIFDFVVEGQQEIKVRGDFAEYVQLDKYSISGEERVAVRIRLPESSDSFGINNIWILSDNSAAIIKVSVPYPDKYVVARVAVPDANAGEEILINLEVSNFGKEQVVVSPRVDVYSNGKLLDSFSGEERFLDVDKKEVYTFSLDGLKYSSGEYSVIAVVDADGDFFRCEDVFRLGEFRVKILDYTHQVLGGEVRKFEVEVESLYDDRISEVYAEIRFVRESSFDGFDSSIVSLEGWEKKVLVGYFDTRGLSGSLPINISVYYDGKVEFEEGVIYVENIGESSDYPVEVSILVLVLLCFLLWKFFRNSK